MDPNIRNQDGVYRRGLVLGLTMAEIMVLILFTLLLALATAIASKDSLIAVAAKEVERLSVYERQLTQLLKDNPKGLAVKEIVQRLQEKDDEIRALQKEVERAKAAGRPVEDIIRELRQQGVPEPYEPKPIAQLAGIGAAVVEEGRGKEGVPPEPKAIAEQLRQIKDLRRENENVRGQNVALSKQIRDSGKGNEFPGCWVTLEGKAESIFELIFSLKGITIRNRALPHRAEEQAKLPLTQVTYEKELTEQEFRRQLAPLYQWSVEQKCRFHALRASTDQATRNDLLNTAGSYFYPGSPIRRM